MGGWGSLHRPLRWWEPCGTSPGTTFLDVNGAEVISWNPIKKRGWGDRLATTREKSLPPAPLAKGGDTGGRTEGPAAVGDGGDGPRLGATGSALPPHCHSRHQNVSLGGNRGRGGDETKEEKQKSLGSALLPSSARPKGERETREQDRGWGQGSGGTQGTQG